MSARMSDIGWGDIWSFLIIGADLSPSMSMVVTALEQHPVWGGGGSEFNDAWGKREGGERVELPDSLMYEAVLQSAGFN